MRKLLLKSPRATAESRVRQSLGMLHYTTLQYTTLHHTLPRQPELEDAALHNTTLRCITGHSTEWDVRRG